MKILFAGFPNAGHRIPCQEFIKELKKAGHGVMYSHMLVSNESPALLSTWLQRFQDDSRGWAEKIRVVCDVFQPDLLISELPIFSMGQIAAEYKLPWVIFSALPYLFDVPSADLFLQASLPEFEGKKDHGNLHFIGPVVRKATGKGSIPPKIKPYVLVTQGTIANLDQNLIQTTKEALKDDYYLVSEPIEHYLYMEYFDVFITNGGFGGVSLAIYHGIPIIVAGETEDKPFVAERVEKSGIGLNLCTANPPKSLIRQAVSKILQDKDMKLRCKKFSMLAKARKLSDAVGLIHNLRKGEFYRPVYGGSVASSGAKDQNPKNGPRA